uniref:Uncharacterized protein n=1 Tax=Avena sativa TaxID=4498 RepID=A0ACD5V2U0_AVESA
MLPKSSPRVAGGASAVLPAHHRQAASGRTILAPASRRTNHLRLAAARASGEAGRGELFSPGSDGPPQLYPIRARRTRTMIPRIAYTEKNFLDENVSVLKEERVARIRKELQEPQWSPSPYDTAWVAMVPLQGIPEAPCFPQCVEWILQSQHDNGSWGINEYDLSTDKSSLLSTLACIIVLKKWDVGPEHISKGLYFIGRNFSVVMDKQTAAPVGFNVNFTGMISLAISMGLEFPMQQTDLDGILDIRRMELERFVDDKSYATKAYMTYIAEGLGDMLDWNEVMRFQRKNGSFFNSPSATAAAVIYNNDDKALQYLNLLVSKFGSSVPTVFPSNIYCQLSMVDSLEKIGISHHFSSEIKSILDMTYNFWLQRDEEIMLDVATCAMAFRILRMNGYDVSSDELSHVVNASAFYNSLQGYLNDTKSLLELYKASTVSISNDENLDNIGYWSSSLLREKMCSNEVHRVPILGEVEYALKFPHFSTMERLDHRRNIEHFDLEGYHMLKTSYLPWRANKDHLDLAVEDFTRSQLIYQGELLHVESWVKENRIDQLKFARQKQAYCYFSAAATFSPELSDARISFAKNSVLITVVDDFFDVAGSKEEIENLVALAEKWDEHHELPFYSEVVKILFFAIYNTVNQLAESASVLQNRDVRKHLIELWIETLKTMSTEAEWVRTQYVPTVDEYVTNANLSYGLGPIIPPSLYFVGHELSESMVKNQEYNELLMLMNNCCRLLNDIQGYEREGIQGKVNSVSLLVLHSGGFLSSLSAKKTIEDYIASCRKDLLRLVVKEDNGVPRACKELFWKMCKINHMFYSQTDGYSSQKSMVGAVNAVIYEPLKLQSSNPSLTVKSEQ